MKKGLLLAITVFLSFYLNGQDIVKFKKGYVGISIGPTIYTGSEKGIPFVVTDPNSNLPETLSLKPGDLGLTINFIDAGYTLWRNWGISLKWQGGAHLYQNSNEELTSMFGSVMIGPMYSISINEKISLDFKARVGRMYLGSRYSAAFAGSSIESTNDYYNLGIEGVSTFRYHFAKKWSWINSIEFQKHLSDSSVEKISRVNLTTGIGFRF